VSVKNKATDRDSRGRIRREYTSRTKDAVHWNAALGNHKPHIYYY